jgi:hypothetical protein
MEQHEAARLDAFSEELQSSCKLAGESKPLTATAADFLRNLW